MPPDADFIRSLAIKSWILYAVGVVAIFARLYARALHFGSAKKYQIDDYTMIFILIPFTAVMVAANEVAQHGNNYSRLRPGNEIITEDERPNVIWGSKMSLMVEQCLVLTLWLLKGCMLLMYYRLTLGRWQRTAVKFLAYYCVIGFIVMQILLFGVWCRPFHFYWAVPVPRGNSQCATYYSHMIFATVFNISSDIMILLIPLPIFIGSIMPLKRKLALSFVFSLGIFVILAAVLNRYYNFSQKYSLVYLDWYVGEVFTAVIVTNIPLMWPLFRRLFTLDSWGECTGSGNTDTSTGGLQTPSIKRPPLAVVASSQMHSSTPRLGRVSNSPTFDDSPGIRGVRRGTQTSRAGMENINIDEELGEVSELVYLENSRHSDQSLYMLEERAFKTASADISSNCINERTTNLQRVRTS